MYSPLLKTELRYPKVGNHRSCFERAGQQYITQLLVNLVRQQFRRNVHETDPDKIQKLKDDAARGLINYILYELEKMTGRKFSKGS
ncbi:hypothetical protein ACJRO7_032591 [Eucalyptus globulus]|uniref:Complex 1 LYR protein domain-containing protein n=1 Tax=Eucalyptus globulus TaxID=34317 RepID=A0ABD3JK50_EUCGL